MVHPRAKGKRKLESQDKAKDLLCVNETLESLDTADADDDDSKRYSVALMVFEKRQDWSHMYHQTNLTDKQVKVLAKLNGRAINLDNIGLPGPDNATKMVVSINSLLTWLVKAEFDKIPDASKQYYKIKFSRYPYLHGMFEKEIKYCEWTMENKSPIDFVYVCHVRDTGL